MLGALQVVEDEYGVNIGLLRPDDEFDSFTDPVSTGNPLSSLFFWLLSQDSTSQVAWELKKKLKSRHVD